ncbi:hypothetical protein OAT42_01215 [Alphaproteobacteria bacterium]|nr:hypothetical protein [Alphaproteobacteria bacterium]
MKIIKYSLNVFIILTLLSCSEDTNEVKNKIFLNGNSIGLSKENFEKLNNLLINFNLKNCNSMKLNNFFKGLDQSFDKNNFTLKFTDSENFEKTIKFQKPNCMNQKMKKL